MNFTPFAAPFFRRRASRVDCWASDSESIQISQLKSLLKRVAPTEFGRRYGLGELCLLSDPSDRFAERVPTCHYEDMRDDVLRMVKGESDVLWPGVCRDFAQSSGTSGDRSKFIPITHDGLYRCHYPGAADCVAHYLRANPKSRIFSAKSFVLGGSFANQLNINDPNIHIGDLSATLINRINPLANLFRLPDKKTALLTNWQDKLPALVRASAYADISNISGVPSWFLSVIKEVMALRGVDKISDAWPNLEVFFHGGISFEPYREIYRSITDPRKMHFVDTYNASEGFFAIQNNLNDPSMLLIIDNDIFYEFIDIADPDATPVPMWKVKKDHVYELLISSSNGLWRYHLGDTVRVVSIAPVKIVVAGRTKTFINAFGEELMENNAEQAIAAACRRCNASISNYTAAPVYATQQDRGFHQWLIEWNVAPDSIDSFAKILDEELRRVNSDYDAKRAHTIFLDPPQVVSLPAGTFCRWLASVGTGKLGGQRKVPRLSNNRTIADAILNLL
ncbi:MAG: GH3 auxin-responsive promoter family protein [Lepagella sp.]